jgi:hypothetical protein
MIANHGSSSSVKGYAPPKTLTIHLSKIPMPELMPVAPPPKPSNLSQRASNLKPASSNARPSSQGNSPSGHRASFFGGTGGNEKKSFGAAPNPPQPAHAPRPGGVSAHNPYNPYVRPPRPASPTLENAVPPSQPRLQKSKPSRVSGDGSQVPYASHPGPPPGAYPQSPPQWGTNPPAAAPPSMNGQPSTIQDFVKDGVSSFGSTLLGRFSTRK